MSSKKNDDRKNIVIVGGGGAGQNLAYAISQKLNASLYNLIVINPLPYRILLPATARMTVSDIDNLTETALVPFEKVFHNGNGTVVEGKVVSIHKHAEKGGYVLLQNEERIDYEVLVLASGAIWEGPIAFPEDKNEVSSFVQDIRKKVKHANSIVLAGGGAVGVEFAGEIRDIYPNKDITIVQGSNGLLNDTYPNRFRKAVEKRLLNRNIKIIFNDFIDDIPQGPVTSIKTRGGKTLKAEAVFLTRGPRPNTQFISSLGSDVLTNRGLVKVRPTLQLPSHPDIFAAGDIVDIREEKQLIKAQLHAALIAGNILAYLSGQPLKPYKGTSEMIVVTIGKNGGVAYLGILWGIVLGDWFARMVKSKDVMVPMLRKAVGYS